MTNDMPWRFEAAFNFLAIVMSSISAMLAAAVTLGDGVGETTVVNFTIWDTMQLRMLCIIGALGGAMLSVLVFPPKGGGIQQVAFKFLASGISGILFTPAAIRWFDITPNSDNIMFCSAAVALCAIGAIRAIVPLATRMVVKKLGLKPEDK